jgi:hypothetical protein
MASDTKNVYAAEPLATGSCLVADLGTAGPTDATTALDPADWTDLGHLGEDGITETTDRSIEKKKNFGGATVKVLQTDYTHTYKFVLLESLNADVLKAVYGEDNVTVTGSEVAITKNKKKLPHKSWVFDTTDTELGDDGAFYRDYIPDGQITSIGDVVRVHTDTIEYEVELEVFEDATGNHVYTWTDNGIA